MTAAALARELPLARFPVAHWRLANGLRVVVQRDPGAPLVASLTCYDAGSRRDPWGRSGLAHLCEHLAFDGPRGADFPARVENAGGVSQAVTSNDRLSFSAVVRRGELPALLALEAQRMGRPLDARDGEALEVQRRVVLDELRQRSQTRARAVAFEELHRRLFAPGHPYGRPPAGEPADIRAVTSGDLEAFVAARFSPRDALLVLVGDVSPDAVEAGVAAAFADLPAGGEPPAAGPGPEAPPSERSASSARVAAPVAEARAYVAWSLAGFGRREWYAAALLMRALAAGRSSPLARELVGRLGLAREVHGHLLNMRDSSTLAFAALQAPGVDPERLERGLRDAVLELMERGPSPDDLARARRKALSDHYFVAQSLDRRADLLASLAWCVGAPERLESEPERYLETDECDLADLGARLRRESVHAAVTLVPAREAA